MPKEWNHLALDQVETIEKTISLINDRLFGIRKAIQSNNLPYVQSPWSQSHTTNLAAISRVIGDTHSELEDQVLAFKMGSKTRIDLDRERNAPAKKKTSPKKKVAKK